jgi:hypothetical protein
MILVWIPGKTWSGAFEWPMPESQCCNSEISFAAQPPTTLPNSPFLIPLVYEHTGIVLCLTPAEDPWTHKNRKLLDVADIVVHTLCSTKVTFI